MLANFLSTITPDVIIGGLVIFLLRVIDMTLDTLRLLFVVRGKRVIVWVLGVVTNTIYIVAISNVLTGKNHPFTILCYAVGYATGNILGMRLEERLAIGYKGIDIISTTKGDEIAAKLREMGYGVTEITGHGKDGTVNIIRTNVKRKHTKDVHSIIESVDPNAFITEDDLIPVNASGYWRK